MSQYTPLQKRIWRDRDFKKSKKDAKLLFLYLISNESINNSGIYEIPISTISEETGIGYATVEQLLHNGTLKNIKYDIENEIVFVVKRRKHSPGGNPVQVEKGILSEFKANSKTFLWNHFLEMNPQFKDLLTAGGQPLTKGTVALPVEIEGSNINILPLKMENEILDHLNNKVGKSYKPTKVNLGFITARLVEGHSMEDIKRVIDIKTEQWLNDEKMDMYLRPQTLFNRTKFSGYVNEKLKFKCISPMDQAQSSRGEFVDRVLKEIEEAIKMTPKVSKKFIAEKMINLAKDEEKKPMAKVLFDYCYIENQQVTG